LHRRASPKKRKKFGGKRPSSKRMAATRSRQKKRKKISRKKKKVAGKKTIPEIETGITGRGWKKFGSLKEIGTQHGGRVRKERKRKRLGGRGKNLGLLGRSDLEDDVPAQTKEKKEQPGGERQGTGYRKSKRGEKTK